MNTIILSSCHFPQKKLIFLREACLLFFSLILPSSCLPLHYPFAIQVEFSIPEKLSQMSCSLSSLGNLVGFGFPNSHANSWLENSVNNCM